MLSELLWFLGRVVAALFLNGIYNVAVASEKADRITFKTTELSPMLYMLEGENGFAGGNVILFKGQDGVVMVDNALPKMLDQLNAEVKKLTGQPVTYLLNTHVHGDHTGNNAYFAQSQARIIAHQNMRDYMAIHGMPTMEGLVPVSGATLPILTFQKQLGLYLNDDDIQMVYIPHAHTNGDAFVYFKKQNVLHGGDAYVNGTFPFVDLNNGGSVDGYLEGLKTMRRYTDSNTRIVPGHGPLARQSDLDETIVMLEESISLVQHMIKQGLSEEVIVKAAPLSHFTKDWHSDFITTERMTQQIYRSLTDQTHLDHIEVKHTH